MVGRRRYRVGAPTRNDPDAHYDWSTDNSREIESGLLKKADSLAELAGMIGVEPDVQEETLARWNRMCAAKKDDDFGRPSGTMMKIQRPPFYAGEVWPVVSNTQGGPVHDRHRRIVDVDGNPIPRLYTAGELGSALHVGREPLRVRGHRAHRGAACRGVGGGVGARTSQPSN